MTVNKIVNTITTQDDMNMRNDAIEKANKELLKLDKKELIYLVIDLAFHIKAYRLRN